MSADRFGRWIGRSLEALEGDCPEAYRALADRFGKTALTVDMGGEPSCLWFEGAEFRLGLLAPPMMTSVTLRTNRAALLDLLEGRLGLLDALDAESLHLRGPIDALCRLEEGLGYYLRGAARSERFAALYREFAAETESASGSAAQRHEGATDHG